jgi:hypothetical protein
MEAMSSPTTVDGERMRGDFRLLWSDDGISMG